MKLNRKWVLVIALLVSLTMATASTLAFLTDRDSEANVFTVGNVEIDLTEDFEQGAELLPGIDIEKKPVITNTGKNDTWVWMTVAVPAFVDVKGDASSNIIHWNYMGGTVSDTGNAPSITAEKLATYKENGWLPEDTTIEDIQNGKYWISNDGAVIEVGAETIDGVDYNVYTFLYNEILEPGETTLAGPLVKVYMDERIDIDPEGNVCWVQDGVAKDLGWNINDADSPTIHVSAYAIQSEGFDTVAEAYAAYNKQWGENGTEYATPSTGVATEAELVEALTAGKSVYLTADVELTQPITIEAGSDVKLDLGDYEITNDAGTLTTGYGLFNIKPGASLTVNGDEGGIVMKTNVTKGISAAIFQNDGDLTINGGSFEANQANSVSGLGAVIAVIDNCVQSTEANVVINGGTFAVTGQGAINIIRSWPIGKGAVTTLTINGGTFKKNPEKPTTYIWTKNDTNNDTAFAYLTVNGGTFEDIKLEVDGYLSKVSVADSITGAEVIEGSICGYLDD